jgi:FK506-binding protein 1
MTMIRSPVCLIRLALMMSMPSIVASFGQTLQRGGRIEAATFVSSSECSNRVRCSYIGSQSHIQLSSTAASAEASTTTSLPEGVTKTIVKQGSGPLLNVGDVATVRYSCYIPDQTAGALPPFAKSKEQKVVVGDGIMVDGWEYAIQTMKLGERSVVRVNDPKFGYGPVGVPPLIPPNSVIEMDVEVLGVEAGVDLGTIASADPLKPRTPASIAEAYNTRRERAALEAMAAGQKEGLEGFIERAKSFYFFGFFEGETGQTAPWYLRPSITFPIAFAVVGVAFAITLLGGAISERGVPVTDELDEIILNNLFL